MNSTARIGIGTALVLGLASSVIVIGNHEAGQTDTPLAQACIGLPANHQLESALFNARAQSTGGFDAICDAVEESLVPGTGSAPSKSESENIDAAGADLERKHRRGLRRTGNLGPTRGELTSR
ncbi:MAG: hypothetical protein JWO52_6318 [Gammaproteobacteria bacterium]|nr:hypothetical protein [Gammaproteobacteria bacterium]